MTVRDLVDVYLEEIRRDNIIMHVALGNWWLECGYGGDPITAIWMTMKV